MTEGLNNPGIERRSPFGDLGNDESLLFFFLLLVLFFNQCDWYDGGDESLLFFFLLLVILFCSYC